MYFIHLFFIVEWNRIELNKYYIHYISCQPMIQERRQAWKIWNLLRSRTVGCMLLAFISYSCQLNASSKVKKKDWMIAKSETVYWWCVLTKDWHRPIHKVTRALKLVYCSLLSPSDLSEDWLNCGSASRYLVCPTETDTEPEPEWEVTNNPEHTQALLWIHYTLHRQGL